MTLISIIQMSLICKVSGQRLEKEEIERERTRAEVENENDDL